MTDRDSLALGGHLGRARPHKQCRSCTLARENTGCAISHNGQYGTTGNCRAVRIAEEVGAQTFISMRMPWRVWSEPLSTRPTGWGPM
jgi:hypothetical protein